MKNKLPAVIAVVSVIASSIFFVGVFRAEAGTLPIPIAIFPETRFESTPVAEGHELVHNFVVRNNGGALLIIERVKTT